jgi:hypothetical protein
MEGFVEYTVEVGWVAMIQIPCYRNTFSGVQKFMGNTHRQTIIS